MDDAVCDCESLCVYSCRYGLCAVFPLAMGLVWWQCVWSGSQGLILSRRVRWKEYFAGQSNMISPIVPWRGQLSLGVSL